MPGNDLCALVRDSQGLLRPFDHSSDISARCFVDERIPVVKPYIAGVQNIGVVEVNVDVCVRVRRIEMHQIQRVPVVPGMHGLVECNRGQSRCRRGWHDD